VPWLGKSTKYDNVGVRNQNSKTAVLNPTREPAYITEVDYSDGAIEKVKLIFVENEELRTYIVSRSYIVDLLIRNIRVRTLGGTPPDELVSAIVIPYPPDEKFITTEGNETKKDNLGELPNIDHDTAVQIASTKDLAYLEFYLEKKYGRL